MIDSMVIGNVSVVRGMLESILESAEDIRVLWSGSASALAAYPPEPSLPDVALVHVTEDAPSWRLLGRLRRDSIPVLLLSQGEIPAAAVEDEIPLSRHHCLDIPFGRGQRAWERFRPMLIEAVRRLAARDSTDVDAPADNNRRES